MVAIASSSRLYVKFDSNWPFGRPRTSKAFTINNSVAGSIFVGFIWNQHVAIKSQQQAHFTIDTALSSDSSKSKRN